MRRVRTETPTHWGIFDHGGPILPRTYLRSGEVRIENTNFVYNKNDIEEFAKVTDSIHNILMYM